MRLRPTWLLLGALLVLAAAIPALVASYTLSVLTLVLSLAVFALSINLLVGYGGMITLGHAGVFATSAYGVAYVATHDGGYVLQIAVGLAAALVVSAVFGAMAVRTTGVYFIMVTLAQGMIIWGLAYSASGITGGQNGLPGIERPPLIAGEHAFYHASLIVLVLVLAANVVIVRSPFGLGLRAVRDNESRARSIGYHTSLHRFLAFMIAGLMAGIAGVLFVYRNGFISPDAAYFSTSGDGMLMVILGGAGTLAGPVVGALAIVYLENVVSDLLDRWPTVMGTVFILVVLFARRGIVGLAAERWAAWSAGLRGRRAAPVEVGAPRPNVVQTQQERAES